MTQAGMDRALHALKSSDSISTSGRGFSQGRRKSCSPRPFNLEQDRQQANRAVQVYVHGLCIWFIGFNCDSVKWNFERI
jgi:hypothetical protein